MKKIFVVTGANGHLGNTILRQLAGQDLILRGLILPCEEPAGLPEVTYYRGDVCDPDSLRPLFEHEDGDELYVLHTAGRIDISEDVSPEVYSVNVTGTKNILALCREYSVKRLVYVSSVHAIPEKDPAFVLSEVDHFSPETVVGGYAKTKAEATQAVLDEAKAGLDAVVVQPSGILGPFDRSGNHLVQMVNDYIHGKLPACVKGGYDFVDVRDVASGCIKAARQGRSGECYILSNRHYEIRDILRMVRKVHGGRKIPVLPMWMARMAAPVLQWQAKCRKKRPLYTRYSLHTLCTNDRFSHDKATSELGYRPRELFQTIRDTVSWICSGSLSAHG